MLLAAGGMLLFSLDGGTVLGLHLDLVLETNGDVRVWLVVTGVRTCCKLSVTSRCGTSFYPKVEPSGYPWRHTCTPALSSGVPKPLFSSEEFS